MSSRTAKFVSAVFASFLAGVSVAALPHSGAVAADECLSGPKGVSPAGKHWYYRVNRETKRHCWYLGDLGEGRRKLLRTASRNHPSPATAHPQKAKTAILPSVADARAELSLSQNNVGEPPLVMATDPAVAQDDQRTNVQDAAAPGSPLTSRWPVSSGVYSSVAPPPAIPRAAPDAQTYQAASPSPVVTPVALPVADPSSDRSAERHFVSIPALLLALGSALALASLAGSMVLRLGGTQQPMSVSAHRYEHSTWETRENSRAPWASAARRANLPRAPYKPRDPDSRVAELLAQLAEQPT